MRQARAALHIANGNENVNRNSDRKTERNATWSRALRRSLASALVALSLPTHATPVYLKTESKFPSGHYSRSWLEGRTKKVQFQRWIRVQTKDKAYGWLPEDHLITSLKLASQGVLTEDVPARTVPELDAIDGRPMLAKGTKIVLLEVQGSWARGFPVAAGREVWIPTESIAPDLKAPITKAFVHVKANLYVMPGPFSRVSSRIREASFVEVVKIMPGWLEVRSGVLRGYLRSHDVTTAEDLGEKEARPAFELASLRSAPLPYADLIRTLPLSSRLIQLATKTLRWGQVRAGDLGDVWWPINEDFEEDSATGAALASREKLPTSSIFARKIFDMASSPAIPSLKFVSARGVYRTIDGQEWTKLSLFQDKNYPIAIAPAGAVFVGPFISDDHGETFQQWIRWDSLVATLRDQKASSALGSSLQILDIRPQDASGRRVQLRLNIGSGGELRVQTDDQGVSWRAL